MDASQLKTVLSAFSLGDPPALPMPLSGGLMHHMYRIETTRGVWALKCLNPAVMQRPAAADNIRQAERIARAMAAHVSAVAAVPVYGDPLLFSGGAYYLLYPWQPGAVRLPPTLTPAHCAKIGEIIGKMHAAQLSLPGLPLTADLPEDIDWAALAKAVRQEIAPWAVRFSDALSQCIRWHEAAQTALLRLSKGLVLSHRDLDPKNVLWEDGAPYLIDWEAAGPIHPSLEFFTALRDWTDDGCGRFLNALLYPMLAAYRAQYPDSGVLWSVVRDAGRAGLLAWLAYNVRRACGIEAADNAERMLGATQVCSTLDTLDTYNRVSAQIVRILEEPTKR